MNYKGNRLIKFLIFGGIYVNFEVFVRAMDRALVGYNGIKDSSLIGYTSLWMFVIGGICGCIISLVNEYAKEHELKLYYQILIDGTIITLIEFISGVFCNIYLGLQLWDYSGMKYNLLGQISLNNTIFWYVLISPLAIWLDDQLTYLIYNRGKRYSLIDMYSRLLKLE